MSLAPYNANLLLDDLTPVPNATIDRNVFFEFNSGQLASTTPNTATTRGIKAYNQPQGRGDDLAYRYRDSKSYGTNAAYHLQDPPPAGSSDPQPINFLNPNTFQIVGPGMDGILFEIADTNLVDPNDPTQDDNITNFSNGRLEKDFE